MGHILYQIVKTNLSIFKKNVMKRLRIYTNEIENRIPFKIKSRCYLEFLTPEKMKLLRSTEIKITKDKTKMKMYHILKLLK